MVGVSDVVTGEAVALDLRPASFATRMLALMVDLLVQVALAIGAAWLAFGLFFAVDAAAQTALFILMLVAILVGLPATVETLTRGRSLGKLAAGLRVVRDDGGPVRLRQALIRALVGFGELYLTFGSPALICSLANRRGKRIGDLLAGTYVVRERTTVLGGVMAQMPPELHLWAATADIGRLPDRLALSVRQFLSRTHLLHPSSRQRLGHELAREVATHVAPPPPANTHPERFLAAVLAERRTRDLARLTREQQRRRHQEQSVGHLPYGLDATTPSSTPAPVPLPITEPPVGAGSARSGQRVPAGGYQPPS